ncbi:MAG TPA: vitamin K epoxide reductase family protein [Gemmatimonadales bacterium]|nr:vitamin K epoxide reductase family protein [Gemmatimonadales bacterium]
MRHRMTAAALALVGLLVSTYLLLYKLGVLGSIKCVGSGGCERVNLSRWSSFLGLPVAAYGVAGYVALLAVALYGLREDRVAVPGPTRWLAALAGLGLLFSLYLLALELLVIHALCLWCTVSGVVILAIFVVSAAALPAFSRTPGR